MNIKQLKIALGALKRCFYDTRLDNLGFCGKNVKLEYPISFHNPRNVFLEDNVIIKSDSLVINTTGKLIMKKNSGAAQRFTVITGNHHPVKNKLFFESVKHRLADIEKDVIVNHMWPVTIKIPHYKETVVVTFADKYSALVETFKHIRGILHTKKFYKYAYVFLSLIVFRII